MRCSECGKEYTDDDVAMDDALLPTGKACKHCEFWGDESDEAYAKPGYRECKGIETGDFYDWGGDQFVPYTGPDFFCAMFKLKKETK